MRSSGFRSRFVLAALLLAVTACQSGTPQAHSSPSSRASASPSATADAARCARLAERHFTPCPPLASELKLPPTTIKNATDGAIDDATAQKWGRAFQLGQAYYYWAIEQNARDPLTAGVLADPAATGNLFGPDLEEIDRAKKEGGVLVAHHYSMPITQLVKITPELETDIKRQGLATRPYGFAVRFRGPAADLLRYPDGREVPMATPVDANYVVDTITWGELRSDRDLGDIWYQYGYYSCDGSVRSACRL
jgi:hypothetical protein